MASVTLGYLASPTSNALTFSGLDVGAYRVLTLIVWGIQVSTDDETIELQVSQSSSFLTGANDYGYVLISRSTSGSAGVAETDDTANSIILCDTAAARGLGNASGESLFSRIELVNIEEGEPRYFTLNGAHTFPSGNASLINGSGIVNNSTEIDGLRVQVQGGGTMSAGKALLVGHT